MAAIIGLLVVVTISLLVTRIAAVALTHTGLSTESARFQARSAFTGVGFTTAEAENVLNHPVRRRIIRTLMLLGNAGIVSAAASLMLGFATGEGSTVVRLIVLAGGLLLLLFIARSRAVDRVVSAIIRRALARYTDLDVRDYQSLLHLAGEYHISELACQPGDWLEDRSLGELKLRDEGITVLGVTRKDGTYLGTPKGDTRVLAGDTLLVYGRQDRVESIDDRRGGWTGDRDHETAVSAEADCRAAEREQDPVREGDGTSGK